MNCHGISKTASKVALSKNHYRPKRITSGGHMRVHYVSCGWFGCGVRSGGDMMPLVGSIVGLVELVNWQCVGEKLRPTTSYPNLFLEVSVVDPG